MKRTLTFLIGVVLAASSLPTLAQFPPLGKKTPIHQRLIEQVLLKSVVVLDHSYQMLDPEGNVVKGNNGSNIYGRTYTLGIITDGAITVPLAFVEPWSQNPNLPEGFKPRSHEVRMRNLSDTAYKKADLGEASTVRGSESLYNLYFDAPYGYQLDRKPGEKEGFYVLFTAKKSLAEQPSGKVSCILVDRPFELNKGTISYDLEVPPPLDPLIGGMYLVPETDDYGLLTFKLVGVLQQEGEKWSMLTFSR